MNAMDCNKPNILILYTDQLSKNLLSCYGCDEIQTTNIDALASEGLKMENFYTPSAVCTPSRGTFLTGKYPFVNGAFRNGVPVNKAEAGLAQYFYDNGYATGYAGKWHLGEYVRGMGNLEHANHLGFKDWKYKVEFGHSKNVVEKNGSIELSKEIGNEKTYTTDWLASQTIEYINNSSKEKPFLFMTSFPDPHQPYTVRPPYDTMFNPTKVKIPETFYEKTLPDWVEFDKWGRNKYFPLNLFDRESHLRRLKAQYLGEIKCIDDNVGRIVQALKEKGIYDNTIIIFTTDHGDYMGEHGLMEKNNLYDSVYHLPMILKGEKNLSGGKSIKSFMDTTDFPKTLASLVGLSSENLHTNGIDRSSIFNDDVPVGVEEVYIHPSDVPRAGIITPEYELAYVGKGFQTDRVFKDHILFDRVNDPLQTKNLFLAPEYKDIVTQLTKKIIEHHKSLKTPIDYLPKEVWYEKA